MGLQVDLRPEADDYQPFGSISYQKDLRRPGSIHRLHNETKERRSDYKKDSKDYSSGKIVNRHDFMLVRRSSKDH